MPVIFNVCSTRVLVLNCVFGLVTYLVTFFCFFLIHIEAALIAYIRGTGIIIKTPGDNFLGYLVSRPVGEPVPEPRGRRLHRCKGEQGQRRHYYSSRPHVQQVYLS